jgi:putative Ca2+/H+ antiporter (TMEM165/GDT1 family)
MDAIVPVLLVSLALEIGDRTQRLAVLLGRRYARPIAVLAGIFLAALALSAIAAAGGAIVARSVNHRALGLMLGLALVSGGSGGFFKVKPAESIEGWRLGALLSSFGAFFILAALDKTMFTSFAFAAVDGAPALTAFAAAAGTTIANMPAVLLADRWEAVLPRWLRPLLGGILVVVGIGLAADAFGLI